MSAVLRGTTENGKGVVAPQRAKSPVDYFIESIERNWDGVSSAVSTVTTASDPTHSGTNEAKVSENLWYMKLPIIMYTIYTEHYW